MTSTQTESIKLHAGSLSNEFRQDFPESELSNRIDTVRSFGPRLKPFIARLNEAANRIQGPVPSSGEKKTVGGLEVRGTYHDRLAEAEREFDASYYELEEAVSRIESLI